MKLLNFLIKFLGLFSDQKGKKWNNSKSKSLDYLYDNNISNEDSSGEYQINPENKIIVKLNEKNSTMMSEDLYWEIVNISFQNYTTLDNQNEKIYELLCEFTLWDILSFQLRTYKLSYDINTLELYWTFQSIFWEDTIHSFSDFIGWIISKGEINYNKVLIDNSYVIDLIEKYKEIPSNFEFINIAQEHFWLTSKWNNFLDYIDLSFPYLYWENYEIIEKYEELSEEEISEICKNSNLKIEKISQIFENIK